MRVQITDRQSDVKVDLDGLRAVVEELLNDASCDGSVNVELVSSDEMKQMNGKYTGRDDMTDVLAFPMGDDLLGDVAVCPAAALEVDGDLVTDPGSEVILYAVHGVLHLLGYDDHGDSMAEMYEKEREILSRFGIEVRR